MALREAFARFDVAGGLHVYGSSGAVHALAHASSWFETGERVRQVNGHVLTADALRRTTRRLLAMPCAQRERLPEIDALRAEIIVPGALVLLEVLERAEAGAITLCDFGVREGLVIDWLQHHTQEVSTLDEVEDLRLRSVLALQAKFGPAGPHTQRVADLSLAMFDGLRDAHELDDGARELLGFAALLHDVGSAIGYDGHAEHSYYVIQHGNLRGLTEEEVAIIANVARYHGKARPRKRDAEFARLDARARNTVRWLSALLRVAEGLDRSHYQLIDGLRVLRRGSTVSLVVRSVRDAQLELWAARRRVGPLEKLLDAEVRIVVAGQAERRAGAAVSVRASGRTKAPATNGNGGSPRVVHPPPARQRPTVPSRDPDGPGPARESRSRAGSREAGRDREPLPAPAAARDPRPHRH